jgi:hypothetical protein
MKRSTHNPVRTVRTSVWSSSRHGGIEVHRSTDGLFYLWTQEADHGWVWRFAYRTATTAIREGRRYARTMKGAQS